MEPGKHCALIIALTYMNWSQKIVFPFLHKRCFPRFRKGLCIETLRFLEQCHAGLLDPLSELLTYEAYMTAVRPRTCRAQRSAG